MDAEELTQQWQRNKDRPAWVRENREAIQEHTDIDEPIPNGALSKVRRWLNDYKGVVTRQLPDAETPTTEEESG
jgi:hypothetical protein